ncbi:MAG: TonB-dependent receptor domain-containing protein [Bacteroidota bacterium]
MKKILFSGLLMTICLLSIAQKNGKISGRVIDGSNGDFLIGVNVYIPDLSKGASTDMDGRYEIKDIPPGKYTVRFTYISYNDKFINDVQVEEGKSTPLDVTMEEVSLVLDSNAVAVHGVLEKDDPIYEIIDRKNKVVSSDGITSNSIKKTPDNKTSDVLKRVSGASVQENKFVIIRGLNDRYNAAFLNGTPLPSSESDRKAFAFDIFPSNMLDNLVIYKTATPDMPGDFAGGIININTKNIPEEKQFTLMFSSSYNGYTTFQNFIGYNSGKTDWLGLDDGSRQLPGEIPSTEAYKQINVNSEKAGYAEKMIYDWSLNGKRALPSMNLQMTGANRFKFFKKDLGWIAGITYQNTPNTTFQERAEYDDFETGSIQTLKYNDTVYNRNILSSALLNFAYKLNDKNQLSLKNIFSINTDSRVIIRDGAIAYDQPEPYWQKSSVKWFTQNQFFSSQLSGEHLLSEKRKIRLEWTGGYSVIFRDVPALLRNVYERDATGKYYCVISDQANLLEGGNMFFSDSKEDIKSLSYHIVMPWEINKEKKISNDIKIGGYHQFRFRDFNARNFKLGKYKQGSTVKFDDELLYLPQDEIFQEQYMGLMPDSASPYNGGFKLNEITKVSDSYKAGSDLHAAFVMMDSKIGKRNRIVWGARAESYRQVFYYIEEGSNIDKSIDTTVLDILPSVNYIFSATEKSNLRISYYRTVSRPEFRELAPFQFYNFIQLSIWSGDPQLKRALIDNADIRFEWFPGAAQLISVTGFYKKFRNPVESVQRTAVSGGNEYYYTNITGAQNFGAELEYRLKLNFFTNSDSLYYLYDSSKIDFINNTTFFTNLSLIKSVVDNENVLGATERPLQGQSPYIINAGIFYQHPKSTFGFAVSYNVVGPRIFVVGNVQEPDVWEKQRHVIDFQLSKSFFKNSMEIKFNVRDALAQQQVFFQDLDKDKKVTEGKDDVIWKIYYSPTYSFNLTWKF